MVLVFILLGICISILLMFLILILSTIKLRVENLQIGKQMNTKKYKVIIEIYFINKIKIFKIKFNNKKLRKICNNKKLQKIDLKKIDRNVPLNRIILSMIKKIKIEKLNLQLAIGTEDAVITSYVVTTIGGLIGALLPEFAIDNKQEKYFYNIQPIYINKNMINMYLESIISIKIVHIIYIVYNLGMKKV